MRSSLYDERGRQSSLWIVLAKEAAEALVPFVIDQFRTAL